MALASNYASRTVRALPSAAVRDKTVLAPAGDYLLGQSNQSRPAWKDMPGNTPEERKARTRASMLWNCDEWHRRERTDLAQALSDGFKLNWSPVLGVRQLLKTGALSLDDVDEESR